MGKLYCKVDRKWCKFLKKGVCTYCNKNLTEVNRCPRLAEIETIRFADLLKQVEFNDVWKVLVRQYPDQSGCRDGYEKVFNTLVCMRPLKHNLNDMFIRIEHSPADKYCDRDWYDVHGIMLDKPMRYGIEFIPWIDWVSMFVTSDTLELLNPTEIVAHCLWEMTYNGFDEPVIQSTLNKMCKDIDEMKKNNK